MKVVENREFSSIILKMNNFEINLVRDAYPAVQKYSLAGMEKNQDVPDLA
jgi:hypothetical protein